MSDAAVQFDTSGDVAVVRLDDGKANALSFDVLESLNSALDRAEQEAKAAVIIGRENKFCAGFDLSVMTGDDTDNARRLLARGAEFGLRVYLAPIPVVLGVTGHALAMGGILLACADYRIGAEGDYKLGLNEVAIGMPVPEFGIELVRDRISKPWFVPAVQHAHIFDPQEARVAGFLDEVVAAHEVLPRCMAHSGHLAETVHPGPFRLTRYTCRGDLARRPPRRREAAPPPHPAQCRQGGIPSLPKGRLRWSSIGVGRTG